MPGGQAMEFFNLIQEVQSHGGNLMKKLSTLLAHRDHLLRQARLANLAFAHHTLEDFARRIARAGLTGDVVLKNAAPEAECYCATLTAIDGSQSVIEEHFTEEDIMSLVDVLAFTTAENVVELTFRIEDLAEIFLTPVRAELRRAGIAIDEPNAPSDAVR